MYPIYAAAVRAARPSRLVLASLALVTAMPAFPVAGSLVRPDDPRHAVAVADTDHDHAHFATGFSPFDAMSGLQLASVPKGKRIHFNAPSKCVPGKLRSVLKQVAAKYGPITVNSTYRSKKRNRRIGGSKNSYHLKCAAVDFRVHASTRGLVTYLRGQNAVGGYKRYRTGFFHIDTGPRRTW